jgi:hypothetical protein
MTLLVIQLRTVLLPMIGRSTLKTWLVLGVLVKLENSVHTCVVMSCVMPVCRVLSETGDLVSEKTVSETLS